MEEQEEAKGGGGERRGEMGLGGEVRGGGVRQSEREREREWYWALTELNFLEFSLFLNAEFLLKGLFHLCMLNNSFFVFWIKLF